MSECFQQDQYVPSRAEVAPGNSDAVWRVALHHRGQVDTWIVGVFKKEEFDRMSFAIDEQRVTAHRFIGED